MATVIEKRPDGSAVLVVPPGEAAGLKIGASVDVRPTGAAADALPRPFGALADRYRPFEIEEIKAARRDLFVAGTKARSSSMD